MSAKSDNEFDDDDSDDVKVVESNKKDTCKKTPDGADSYITDLFKHVDIKKILFLFIACMLVTSRVFVDNVLGKYKNNTVDGAPTIYGNMTQSLFVCVGYILVDILVNNQFI